MKTRNIAIGSDLHQKFKVVSAQLGCDLHELIAAALTEWMAGELWRPWARLHLEKNIKAIEPKTETDSTLVSMPVKIETGEIRTIGSKNFIPPPGMEDFYK